MAELLANVSLFVDSTSTQGFLHDFDVSSIDPVTPGDDMNREIVVQFNGQFEGYKMMVMMKDGKREGIATILRPNNTLYMRLKYVNGEPEGEVTKNDKFGNVILKGELRKGVEFGTFQEFNDRQEQIWVGFYRNGARYSTIRESEAIPGYYDEIDLSGELLSISQYDSLLKVKNGKCYTFADNKLFREYFYVNGEEKPVHEFHDNNMMVYDDTCHVIYNGPFCGDMIHGFFVHPPMEEMPGYYQVIDERKELLSVSQYDALNVKKEGISYEFENTQVSRVCEYHADELHRILIELIGDIMIKYDEQGKRIYEGGYGGDMITGYYKKGEGTEYQKDGETALYVGDFDNDYRNGYGTEYNGIFPYYIGLWQDGLRHGEGREMDENGQVVKSGIWDRGCLPGELLKVGDYSLNTPSNNTLTSETMTGIRRIEIGCSCYAHCSTFDITDMPLLECIQIGSKSFTLNRDEENSDVRRGRVCRITNCPKLKSISFGDYAFSDYAEFELENLPSLESLSLGWWCFCFARSLHLNSIRCKTTSLSDLPSLRSITLQVSSFCFCHFAIIENLPKLERLELGDYALRGDEDHRLVGGKPFTFQNHLVLKNLPLLTTLIGGAHVFQCMGTVRLENLPKLYTISLKWHPFRYVTLLTSDCRSNLFDIVRKNAKYLRFVLITASANQVIETSSLNTNHSWDTVKEKSKGCWSSIKNGSKGCWSSLKTGSGGCWNSFKTKSAACWTAVKRQSSKGWKVVKEKSAAGWHKVVDWSKKGYQYCKTQCERCRPRTH